MLLPLNARTLMARSFTVAGQAAAGPSSPAYVPDVPESVQRTCTRTLPGEKVGMGSPLICPEV